MTIVKINFLSDKETVMSFQRKKKDCRNKDKN